MTTAHKSLAKTQTIVVRIKWKLATAQARLRQKTLLTPLSPIVKEIREKVIKFKTNNLNFRSGEFVTSDSRDI